MKKRYTIMLVPDRSSNVRRFRVAKATLWIFSLFVFLLLGAIVAAGVHYWSVIDKLKENDSLRRQNVQLRGKLVTLNEKTASIQDILDRVQRFDTKLRSITQLSDPKRHLALGPFDARPGSSGALEGAEGVDPLVRAIGENPQMAVGLLGQRLDELAAEAERREGSIRQLETYLRGQKSRLASTPSIWPSRGWVTSGFGTRKDPYTGKRTMHRGIDIANQPGVPVIAPARGVAIFRGNSGGFGKVIVLEHGYGIRTRYGHLEEYKVQLGDHVERGDIIGTIGNTGRSTGPHLHYEVEVNGIAENPKNYILED
jgi:murein DD-endopeptidase MepM/ murein hydrolase activator NlpD